jgi:hypothetical protein
VPPLEAESFAELESGDDAGGLSGWHTPDAVRVGQEILQFGLECKKASPQTREVVELDFNPGGVGLQRFVASLAVPVWTLISFVPDWRWLMQRDDSPSIQACACSGKPKIGDWQSVLEPVRVELILTGRGSRGLV